MKKYNKEFMIGLSVIIAGLILFFGIDYLKGINLLNPSHFYVVKAKNVSGLEQSAPVTINGYKVGQVREISYDYDNPGNIKILLAVNDKLKLPEGSYAKMASTLLSGAYIDLVMGEGSAQLENGSEIPLESSKDIMDALTQDMLPKVNNMIPHIDSLISNLNSLVADPALVASIRRLDGITANVEGLTAGLQTTVRKDVPPIMRNARNFTFKIDSLSTNLIALSNTLNQLPLVSTMDNVNQLTDQLSIFSRQLNDKNSTLGMLTNDPELYNRLNRVAADVDSLIVDIKRNPKRYISIKVF